jgi:hypothetical protein
MKHPLSPSRRNGGFTLDLFVPFVLLAVSFIVLLVWQVKMAGDSKKQLEDAITRQEPADNQSNQVQAGVSKLLTDLLAAAQTDDGAKAIVTKYKIQQAGSPAPASSP